MRKATILEFDFTDPSQHGCKIEFRNGSQDWLFYQQSGFEIGDDVCVTIHNYGQTPKGYSYYWDLDHPREFIERMKDRRRQYPNCFEKHEDNVKRWEEYNRKYGTGKIQTQ